MLGAISRWQVPEAVHGLIEPSDEIIVLILGGSKGI
jgi:hypothetical protein